MSTSDQEPNDQAAQRPMGVEEQKVIEIQERGTEPAQQIDAVSETEEPETITPKEQVDEFLKHSEAKQKQGRKEDPTRKIFEQFTRHFHISKMASDKTANTLNQMQKQLTQIEKIASIGSKQQVVVKQLAIQVRMMRRQLDRISTSITRIKTVTSVKGKAGSVKRKKK